MLVDPDGNSVGFLVVWYFLIVGLFGCLFFAVWAEACFNFCCLGGGVFIFLLFGRGVFFFGSVFLLFGRGACFYFCCLDGGVFILLLSGRGACFFAVWAGGVSFFFAVWAGDGSSLTYRSAWLVFKGPNNKKDQTTKNKHGFQI